MIETLLLALALTRHGPGGPATCDGGSGYYDPTHQVCQPYPPANPQPGYGQFCGDGNYYDPAHQVCQPNPPAYPPPMYPDY